MSKEHPIIFSGDMVKAILAGRKSQTRRVVNPQRPEYSFQFINGDIVHIAAAGTAFGKTKCPYGKVGDRLWVREAFFIDEFTVDHTVKTDREVYYKADNPRIFAPNGVLKKLKWKPSIHMPRWASRITLEVTGVRVERVQDISKSKADQEAEGIAVPCGWNINNHERCSFGLLWDSINHKRGFGWDVNPFCWVLSFKRLDKS